MPQVNCKIQIIDLHPQTKLDAPSGTALELGEEIAGSAPDKTFEDITFHSVRAGEHTKLSPNSFRLHGRDHDNFSRCLRHALFCTRRL